MKDLSLIEDDDGNEFGNRWSTTIFTTNFDTHHFDKRPNHWAGVHGITIFEGDFHLLSEDDGHFWTHSVLTEEEVHELKAVVDQLISEIKFGPKYSVRPKVRAGFKYLRDHPKFPIAIAKGGREMGLVAIECKGVKGDKLTMSPFWLRTLSQTLDIS